MNIKELRDEVKSLRRYMIRCVQQERIIGYNRTKAKLEGIKQTVESVDNLMDFSNILDDSGKRIYDSTSKATEELWKEIKELLQNTPSRRK